jgi:hypothetical protein
VKPGWKGPKMGGKLIPFTVHVALLSEKYHRQLMSISTPLSIWYFGLTADLRCRCTPTKMGRDPERLLS